MKILTAIVCISFLSIKSYGDSNSILECWDYPDQFHPKVTINRTIDGYELEVISLPNVQDIAEQLFPKFNNSFAERLIIKLKKCEIGTSHQKILTCSSPYDVSYYDWGGSLMNQQAFDDDSNLSFVSTSYKTKESTVGKVDWISFNISLVSKSQRANREINFYTQPLCGAN